ncbi:MAG TPA: response regulator [Pirellulales bacterium]|nr:response regulator [Pirellulales bacterium]
MKILVVDDDVVCRDFLVTLLRQNAYEVLTAENGREALEILAQTDCRMVITDWVMPQVNGLTLCRAIREADRGDYVFVILLTSRDSHQDLIEGLAAGADDFMTKPFHPVEVRARIRTGERILAVRARNQPGNGEIPPAPLRFPYAVQQWVAPHIQGRAPEAEDFVLIECNELHTGGVSFCSPDPCEFDELVVTLGTDGARLFMLARVTGRNLADNWPKERRYLLECEFVRRMETDIDCWTNALKTASQLAVRRTHPVYRHLATAV